MGAFESVLHRPNYGCAAPVEELAKMWPRVVAMDMEAQSGYADYICRSSAQDPEFNREQLEGFDIPASLPFNTTGIANLAYLALNAPPEYRDQWRLLHGVCTAMLKKNYNL